MENLDGMEMCDGMEIGHGMEVLDGIKLDMVWKCGMDPIIIEVCNLFDKIHQLNNPNACHSLLFFERISISVICPKLPTTNSG